MFVNTHRIPMTAPRQQHRPDKENLVGTNNHANTYKTPGRSFLSNKNVTGGMTVGGKELQKAGSTTAGPSKLTATQSRVGPTLNKNASNQSAMPVAFTPFGKGQIKGKELTHGKENGAIDSIGEI